MALQALPRSAEQYARDQRLEIEAAVSAVRRQWRHMGTEFDASYAVIAPTLLQITDRAQERIALAAQDYVPAVLAETGQDRAVEPRLRVRAASLVGVSGDGLTTDGLLYGAVIHAKQLVGDDWPAVQALASSAKWLSTAVGTLLSDTGRASEKLGMMARPVTGYVRMLQAPSCGRCVILAGRRSRSSQPFLRHPRCDCRNIPASESVAGDLTVDSRAYLESLDDQGLARALGSKANAQAFRDGADQNQIVNAYRRKMLSDGTYTGGVRSAQVYGRSVRYTTEGTTKRGRAFRGMAGTRVAQSPRLMPESIAQIATDDADRVRLLRRYGWIA